MPPAILIIAEACTSTSRGNGIGFLQLEHPSLQGGVHGRQKSMGGGG
eukprot:COSAG03_NODE_3694_length_1874_cov_2.498592_3_plen_46_part_01